MSEPDATPAPASNPPASPHAAGGRSWECIGPLRLLIIFSQITMVGFGGVLPFAYRELVERRRLLSNAAFSEMFAFGQVMPGPAIVNFALTLGYRDSGAAGAVAAVAGIVSLPFLLLVVMGIFYFRNADVALVREALHGMAVVTGGLVVAVALKMARGMHRNKQAMILLLGVFLSFGLMRWPFLAVMAVAGPLAFWLSWRERP
jgi:chromate transporter